MRRSPLIFVRHGETDWNRAERFQGQQDIALNDLGRRQAARNGRALAGILGSQHWRLVASPLGRTVETVRILLDAAGRAGEAFETDEILREACYGDWEGLTPAEIAERDPESHRLREADKWGHVPPAGESYSMVADRCARWLKRLDGPTLMVSHGGVLRGLLHHLAGLPSHDVSHLAVPQDRVILFTRDAVLTI